MIVQQKTAYLAIYRFSNGDIQRGIEVMAENKKTAWSIAYNKIFAMYGLYPYELKITEV